jgi:hypothetical protein
MRLLLARRACTLAALGPALIVGLSACATASAPAHASHVSHAGRSGPASGHAVGGTRAARHKTPGAAPEPVPTIRPGRGNHGGSAACGALTASQVAAILGAPAQGRKPSSAAPDQKLCTYGLGPKKTAAGLKFRTLFVLELQCGRAAAEAWPYYREHGAPVGPAGGGVRTADRAGGNNAGVRLRNGCVLSATAAFARTGNAVPGSRTAMYRVLAEAGS